MVPAGQSSHTAVTGIPAARQHKQMRGARAAMAQAMVPRSSHTAVLSTVRPHAPLSNARGAPPMAMSPGVPTIPTPTGNPHASQQQRAAMARHPAPTSARAIGAPIQPTEPHAPLPNTGGEGAPPPARTVPPPSSQAATTSAPPTAAATPLQRPPAQATTQRYYVSVQRDKGTGKWAACVVDPSNPTRHRLVGAFPDAAASTSRSAAPAPTSARRSTPWSWSSSGCARPPRRRAPSAASFRAALRPSRGADEVAALPSRRGSSLALTRSP
ncbi:hypothetical protein OsI_34165 [Oryza sativa Indica Group]|uniref:Uncharacterized protein n=1 Tax=Oryza sativa subsp. indica TaxID=39946 RepID=A2Z8X1_ORYSI|nr:hypothetical protein OsI_34165 [Oryza sativa Indica Group]